MGQLGHIYWAHNKGEYVVAERFIRFWKNKVYKYMTSISNKKMYIDSLADTVNRYIKMKPVGVTSSTYIDFSKENNKEDLLNLKLVSY